MSHGTASPSYRQRVGYQAGLLGGFALIAAAMLVMGDVATRETIALRKAEDLKASLSQVIPPALHDNDLVADAISIPVTGGKPVQVWRAATGGVVTGAAFQVSGNGYAGPIDIILGLDADGRILGARVLAHKETPGLGDKIEVTRGDWIHSFDGRGLDDPPDAGWAVKKDGGIFDQFSGATITPRAVVQAVRGGLRFFADHRDAILAPPVTAIATAPTPPAGAPQ